MKYSETVSYLRERLSPANQSVSLPEIGIDVATQPFTSRSVSLRLRETSTRD